MRYIINQIVEAIEAEIHEAWTESDADFNRGMEYAVSIVRALDIRTDSDTISRQDAIAEFRDGRDVYDIMESIESLPSAEPKTDEENELKFYYVESIDDYWIGRRLDNFYYADWHDGLGFVWSKSRYLPWGEHIVDENTLWKEHTYPSEPIEVPFAEWIVGFVKKYFAEPKTGEWMRLEREENVYDLHGVPTWGVNYMCDKCGFITTAIQDHFGQYKWCPSCGADMRGEDE